MATSVWASILMVVVGRQITRCVGGFIQMAWQRFKIKCARNFPFEKLSPVVSPRRLLSTNQREGEERENYVDY